MWCHQQNTASRVTPERRERRPSQLPDQNPAFHLRSLPEHPATSPFQTIRRFFCSPQDVWNHLLLFPSFFVSLCQSRPQCSGDLRDIPGDSSCCRDPPSSSEPGLPHVEQRPGFSDRSGGHRAHLPETPHRQCATSNNSVSVITLLTSAPLFPRWCCRTSRWT